MKTLKEWKNAGLPETRTNRPFVVSATIGDWGDEVEFNSFVSEQEAVAFAAALEEKTDITQTWVRVIS